MILRRLTNAFRKQDWFTVAVETLIVVFGVFIGLQVNNWNEARQEGLREAYYLDRLDQELDVIRARLADGADVFERSIRNIDLLLSVHRDYREDPDSPTPNDDVLATAVHDVTSGRVPAGSPAAFKEMVANGALRTLKSDALRQSLFAYDEFTTVARDGWHTLRDEQHVAANHMISLIDASAPARVDETGSRGGVSEFQLVNFKRAAFLEDEEMPGHLTVLLRVQLNQRSLVTQQLLLAEDIESQIVDLKD